MPLQLVFLRATAVPAGTAVARISYGNYVCPSVCPSVTTRYGFNQTNTKKINPAV